MFLNNQKSYLDFIDQTFEYINDLTVPLKKCFNITNFGHLRIFFDNHYFCLMNSRGLIHDYVKTVKEETIFFKQFLHVPNSEYKFVLWPNEPTNHAMELFQKYNYWNGITLIRVGKEYIDLWWFAADVENKNISEFFIRNTTLLYKYMLFFEEKTRHLTPSQPSDYLPIYQNGIDLSVVQNSLSKEEQEKVTNFLEEIKLDGITVPLQNGTVFISSREVECLALMMQGLNAKGIGSKLLISPRTVETHFKNIKRRFN